MSEWINNATRRKEILKNVLRQLHEGRSIESVTDEFGELAREASSTEIAQIEQQLIDEGLPAEEIQKLCNVHVAVFRGGLDEQRAPETLPGHPIYTFRAENKMALGFLNGLKIKIEAYLSTPSSEALAPTLIQLEKMMQYEVHYKRKENLLFPYLEQYGFSGPSQVMWGIQDQIRAQMKQLHALLTAEPENSLSEIGQLYPQIDQAIREMFYKEEKILFPAALGHLTLQDWANIRAQEAEIGYFSVRPGNQWPTPVTQPENAASPDQALTDPIPTAPAAAPVIPLNALPLDTGALTLEQINLMLCNLPVDVTFVDENDEVRFFSQTRERIFQRLPAIIGRKVQNCHPPQSVDRVQRILDDFRSGQRSVAEFWIQMHGQFIHIRYFALRDGQGRYRGTIEVSQEVSGIRALEGERRLLNENSPA